MYSGRDDFTSEIYSCNSAGDIIIDTFIGPYCTETSHTGTYVFATARGYNCGGGECDLYTRDQVITNTSSDGSCDANEISQKNGISLVEYRIEKVCVPFDGSSLGYPQMSYIEYCYEGPGGHTTLVYKKPDCSGGRYAIIQRYAGVSDGFDPDCVSLDESGFSSKCECLNWVNCDADIPTSDPTYQPTTDPIMAGIMMTTDDATDYPTNDPTNDPTSDPIMAGMTSTEMMDAETTNMESTKNENPSNMSSGVMIKCLMIGLFITIVLLF